MELNALSLKDREEMLDLLTNHQIRQTYMLPDFVSREDAVPLFHRLMALSRKDDRYVRGIYVDGILVGFLNDVEILGRVIELGYVVHPNHWGCGFATTALKRAIGELYRLGYEEVIAGAFAENTASIRVMEKAGMQQLEKTDEIEYRGKLHHCVYYVAKR